MTFLENNLKLKKAAMFGLDARIALAIFGALSVITGAALFSAIQNSKIVSIVAEFNELEKAYAAFLLDTGVHITRLSAGGGRDLASSQLVENPTSIAGWNGPYINHKKASKTYLKASRKEFNSYIFLNAKSGDWGASPIFGSGNTLGCSEGDKECIVWIAATVALGEQGLALANALDVYLDGEENFAEGSLRHVTTPSWRYIMYRTNLMYPR